MSRCATSDWRCVRLRSIRHCGWGVPDVAVDVPTVDFGVEPTPGDPVLDKAVETLTAVKKAA